MIENFACFAFFSAGLALLALAFRSVREAWAAEARVKLQAIAIDSDNQRKNIELSARLEALNRLSGKPTPPASPPQPPVGKKKIPTLVKINGGE